MNTHDIALIINHALDCELQRLGEPFSIPKFVADLYHRLTTPEPRGGMTQTDVDAVLTEGTI